MPHHVGDAESAAALDRFAEAGITRAVLELRSDSRDEVMKTLDGFAELIG